MLCSFRCHTVQDAELAAVKKQLDAERATVQDVSAQHNTAQVHLPSTQASYVLNHPCAYTSPGRAAT